MNRMNSLFLILGMLFIMNSAFGQERAPLKNFDFSISLNRLKTEQQATDIRHAVNNLPGVKNCQLVLIDYALTFSCTNHDMNDYKIIDRVKAVIVENGAEIVNIKRSEK